MDVRLFGPRAVMTRPNRMPHPIEGRFGCDRPSGDETTFGACGGLASCDMRESPANSVPLDQDMEIEGIVSHGCLALLFLR